jgi:hypothetical protein
MTLLKCVDCGHVVSDLAASCPHCGRPVSTMMPPPPSEPAPPPPEASTKESTGPPLSEYPKASGGCVAAIVVAAVLAVILVAILASTGDHSVPAKPSTAQEQPPKPPSAAELLAMLNSESAAGRPESALRYARDLVNSHSGTPEAEQAASQLTELEAAVQAAQEAERARAAEAAAEAEAQRLAAKWGYRVDADPMTSRKARYASIQSENALNFDCICLPYTASLFSTTYGLSERQSARETFYLHQLRI